MLVAHGTKADMHTIIMNAVMPAPSKCLRSVCTASGWGASCMGKSTQTGEGHQSHESTLFQACGHSNHFKRMFRPHTATRRIHPPLCGSLGALRWRQASSQAWA